MAHLEEDVEIIHVVPPRSSCSSKRRREQCTSEAETFDLTTAHPVPIQAGSISEKRRHREQDAVEVIDLTTTQPLALSAGPSRRREHDASEVEIIDLTTTPLVQDCRMVAAAAAELGDFPEERDWFVLSKSYVTGLSTSKRRKKLALDAGEIVHFAFPSVDRSKKQAAIVRFSTKRSGEIGELSPEWTKCLVPLLCSSKVKIQGKVVFPTMNVRPIQEIMLYVSFYIHSSAFTQGNTTSWNLLAPSKVHYSENPLYALFKLLKLAPFSKADFTPDDLNARKRTRNLTSDKDAQDEPTPVIGLDGPLIGGQVLPVQRTDKKAIYNAETYDLKEAEPPSTLVSVLKPYQKEALFWMSELEKGIDDDQMTRAPHPCFSGYKIVDKRIPAVYLNVFSGEATTRFPSLSRMPRGGILADAMGLGKTVMTIALILSDPRGEWSNYTERDTRSVRESGTNAHTSRSSVRGGTLIVCPMALLGQWKDELEAHSAPEALSVFVYYGGDKTDNIRLMAEHSIVLTTYGVLQSAYKADARNVFHRIDWYRIVLDEAHTIKSPKTQVAKAAYSLTSQCRWCLTGTPLQNNLEDLYSLLCFLRVEPWCDATWWQKLVQKPYESGDARGMKLVKAILRPLMLRRTKETKDKTGNLILVLPPAHIEVVVCEQSVEERDFYEALFRRSKVQFNEFVAQGNVLSNYANILELLLRLRQCCDHPFLVISKADTQKYTDLDEVAQRFLGGVRGDSGRPSLLPSQAYAEEVVEEIRQEVATVCPICLELASDDPVLTPCGHRMCRECLLSSWRSPVGGPCPLCRSPITKAQLITLPSQCHFDVDAKNNWKDSCKVVKLITILQGLEKRREKSIVFSQFTSFFDLLEIPFTEKGIKFLRYDGKLSQKHREEVLKEFSESQDKLVLLMSLKAGGVGLNLTAASNAFIMDPWWNPAVEEQAIMRIHRIGQKSAVKVMRFIVKDSVEERMQQVQARKQQMISGALTDEDVRSSRIEELKMLFK